MFRRKTDQEKADKNDILSWLKDHTVHIMVLVNGIVLTFAMFWTVNLFVGQMLKDEYDQAGRNASQSIASKLEDFENIVKDYASYFQSNQLNQFGQYSIDKTPSQVNMKIFDSLMWIPVGNPAASAELKSKTQTTIDDDRFILSSKANEILTTARGQRYDPFLYTGKISSSRIQGANKLVESKPVAVVKAIKLNGQLIGYLAGFSTIDKIAISGQLSQDDILKATLWDRNNVPVYSIQSVDGASVDLGKEFKHDFFIQFAKTNFKGEIFFKKSSKNALLEYLSWLLSSFIVIVTLIGWFYVSNNYNKSRTLSRVNGILANKNEQLNDQIREREKLFQTLRKSERENRAIINAVSDVIFEISPSGEILFLNEAWIKITGFDLETSLGGNLFELLYPGDQEEQRLNIVAMAKGQKTAYRVMTKIRTSSGEYRSVEMAVSMLRQDDNKNLRVIGSFTDIEERQRAEMALVEAEKKYKTIWENAAGGIYQLTPEGRFLSANPALARILGFDRPQQLIESIVSAHEQLFVDPQARFEFIKNNRADSQDSILGEFQVWRADGRKIWIQENFRTVTDMSGHVLYYEGSMEDVTERKNTEVQLKEAKIQSDMASRAKSEFLANISHELRTPLNSIIGFSEIIKNEVFGPIEPKSYTEYAGNIYDSGRNLLGIINQILDISRIDAGERELNESLIDVRKLCMTCLDLTRPKVNHAGLTMIDHVPENLPKIIAEEVAVKQMLLNLLSNAVKFTPHGGRVTLSAEMEPGGGLRISVTDTGVGLSEEQIEKASVPFGLVDGRLDKGTGGAGLGLSLVHSLLRLHKGKLELVSQRGIGTTATIIFPANRVQA